MIKGSCLCGGIHFEIDEEFIYMMNNCHCESCRKVSASAYGTFVQVPGAHFRWLEGRELISLYESSPGNHRAFCSVCGSNMPQSRNWEKLVTVHAGTLDGDPGAKPALNGFVSDSPGWYAIDESMPTFSKQPTGISHFILFSSIMFKRQLRLIRAKLPKRV
jgi:hypothetical protein